MRQLKHIFHIQNMNYLGIFFQFNSTALECLFNEALGFDIIDSGLDSPIVGRFAYNFYPTLKGTTCE